jgi:hypothetical protein
MGKQLHRYYLQPRLVMRLERIAFLQLNLHGVHVFASDGGAELVGPLQHPKVGDGFTACRVW